MLDKRERELMDELIWEARTLCPQIQIDPYFRTPDGYLVVPATIPDEELYDPVTDRLIARSMDILEEEGIKIGISAILPLGEDEIAGRLLPTAV